MDLFRETSELIHHVEPTRQTFLNVILDNLKRANRINYIHRLIYIGEHSFPSENNALCSAMKRSIDMVNGSYNDEPLTGIFLHYPKYFCHLLEGSEDSIVKHLLLLTENENNKTYLGRMKMLVCYHHINQRFVSDWKSISEKPPTLLEKLDAEQSDLHRSYRYIYNCIKKLYKLADTQKPNSVETIEMDCLPEFGLLEFLLSTKHTVDLYVYLRLYGVIPIKDDLKDLVWPAPSEFVPFHIFDKPVDPVCDLPSFSAERKHEPESKPTEEKKEPQKKDVEDAKKEEATTTEIIATEEPTRVKATAANLTEQKASETKEPVPVE
ncbi:hypothetical protein FQR65_LT05769 [Abscondita terminalis]|nr:hypothetical protein FQR65_LT05769 [Abscondita terminalis]